MKNTDIIKVDDYVLVSGEGNQVFQVINLIETPYKGVVLKEGWCEERKKCWRIPEKYHDQFYKDPSIYIDISDIKELQD